MNLLRKHCLHSNNELRHLFTCNQYLYELSQNKYKNIKIDGINQMEDHKKKSLESPQMYCMECVKKYDYENYLSTLLLKEWSLKRSAFAIRAFNVELSQIRDLTTTQLMAQIRLQFWLDSIDDIFTNAPLISGANQPIAYEIQRCESNAKLAKHWFKKLIETRMNTIHLSDFPFNTLHHLEEYCDSTVSPVYYLIIESALSLLEDKSITSNQRITLDHIASHVGRGQGLTNILRGVLHNAKYNRCYIPSDLLIKYKSSHEDFLRMSQIQTVKDVCFEMASVANQHIQTANSLIKQIPKHQRLIFLPIVAVNSYLTRLQKCDFNVFDPKLTLKQGLLPLSLWYRSKLI